jgi:hypothetical protein
VTTPLSIWSRCREQSLRSNRWQGHLYFLIGDEIVVVDPDSLEIVAVSFRLFVRCESCARVARSAHPAGLVISLVQTRRVVEPSAEGQVRALRGEPSACTAA